MSTTHDEDADLEAGFTTDATAGRASAPLEDEPAPAQQGEPEAVKPETGEQTAAEQPPESDPLAGLPPVIREMLADYQRTKIELDQIKRHVGQVQTLQSRVDKLLSHQAPPPKAEPPRFEKVARLRDEGLPEIADALEELASALPQPKNAEPAQPDNATTTDATAAVDTQMEVLDEVRPGWADLVFGNDFQLWLSTQPAPYQAEVRGASKAKVILSAITKYEQAQARTTQHQQASEARSRRMAAAVTPRGDGRTLARQGAVDDEDADLEAGFNRQTF